MLWVAIEDADTWEISEFQRVSEGQLLDLMDGYRVDKHNATKFHMGEWEGDTHIVYEGVTYKGGFGYNLWVASKYAEV